mgnify:CR=1 FL=1
MQARTHLASKEFFSFTLDGGEGGIPSSEDAGSDPSNETKGGPELKYELPQEACEMLPQSPQCKDTPPHHNRPTLDTSNASSGSKQVMRTPVTNDLYSVPMHFEQGRRRDGPVLRSKYCREIPSVGSWVVEMANHVLIIQTSDTLSIHSLNNGSMILQR